jgi:MarR family 2-MHQ and catechol resistance regulon transcriptional repressor
MKRRSEVHEAVIQSLRTANALWRVSRRFFGSFGLTEAQFNVLNLLADHPQGMSQTHLSEQLLVDRSNITLLLDRMGKRDWVLRKKVFEDRRAYRVVLTTKGSKLLGKVLPHYERAIQVMMMSVRDSEAKKLIRILKKMELEVERFNRGLKG